MKNYPALVPVEYQPAMGVHICERLAGGEPITHICKRPGFPDLSAIYQWVDASPEFAADLEQARRMYGATLVDQAIDIADDDSGDWREVVRKDGTIETVFNHEHATRSKLRVDIRKWVAGKMDRNTYGDSKQIDVNAKILTINLTDEELDKRLAAASTKLLDIQS